VVEIVAVLCASGIVLVWIVYPILIGYLARRCRCRANEQERDPAHSFPLPSVSVIIATRDDSSVVGERIADCLRAAHDPERFEVIVAIDARSTNGTLSDLDLPPNVQIVPGDAPGGKAATLNAAVRAAHGELLLFTDAQQRFAPGAVSRLAAAFADERVGAASGRLELSDGASRSPVGRYWSYERWLRRCEGTLSSCVGATGAIWAVRRSLWTPLPAALILDDVYAPMRVVMAGRRVVFVDAARAVDLRRPEPGQEYRRKVRTLTGVVQLCCWLPQLLIPARNPIWMQFMFHKLLRLLTPYWLIGLVASAGWLALHWLETNPVVTGVPLFAIAALSSVRKLKVARVLRSAVVWGVTLQAALVVATVNGVRRRWDVWGA
jgi:cellulose synthase/poly-beta-1,6-N-acetylglucosamine synthase-like glycosyltransferase